jgi:hypothetical protein
MFIEKLNLTANLDQVTKDLDQILTHTHWDPPVNQISLVHRPDITDMSIKWRDGVGSLIDNGVRIAEEHEFSVINDLVPSYTKQILHQLAEHQGIDIGRSRFMNLQSHRGLSVHKDDSVRYHLVIKTHPHAYVGRSRTGKSTAAICHHLPADGYFYKVDTTVKHFVYNGSPDNRIHLVICPR